VAKVHHNLETSESFFPKICSTHLYCERIKNIQNLKTAGVRICSGGIFGMGETWKDRIQLACTLKKLEVDSVPLNFLIPVGGTPLESKELLTPQVALKIIALFRFILPKTDIRICAGREKILRDLQSLIFYAGATGMMIGGYLTQSGRNVADDMAMLSDLGLRTRIKRPHLR
jgi:biotin synthase